MRYFITGATGFIGANLALRLAKAGNRVTALVRTSRKAALLKHDNIDLLYGSLEDEDVLREGMNKVDGVFHLAAYAKPWAKDPNKYNRINLEIGRAHV